MSTTGDPNQDHALGEQAETFLREYYRDAIGTLAQRYPKDQRSLAVDYDDIYQFDPAVADDTLDHPGTVIESLEAALGRLDFVGAVNLDGANVRIHNCPETHTHYPDEFSPTKEAGHYRTIEGDVLMTTDVYSKIQKAVFDCQRCGTHTRIPQPRDDWQEPHECQGCERQGPFQVNFEQSSFKDGQTIQLQTPPEQATGEGRTLQVFVEEDLCDGAEMGDRVAISGILRLDQQTSNGSKQPEFTPYLEGYHIGVTDSASVRIDIDGDDRERVQALASGEHGDPLTLAARSLDTSVHGYETVKKALILAMVGGATQTPDVRGEFHVLLIGDPSTAKSQLVNRCPDIAARCIQVTANDTTSAGLTSTASRGEFSDGRWTLKPGAFVKANEGIVAIDELDDLDPKHRKSMLEPMADQQINVSKAGINATLSTQTAVIAAANPEGSRFEPYEPLPSQFGFDSNLLSRFDLVYTFVDSPDEDVDAAVADHTTKHRDATIRDARGDDLPEDYQEIIDQPVSDETLRVWLSLAKRQPDPVYAADDVRQQLRESFTTLRGANGYSETAEVPVTFRKLPGIERIARAHAKLEFSETIELRHAETAMELVGQSLQDYQKDEDGTLDADISEVGRSQSQKAEKELVKDAIRGLQKQDYSPSIDEVAEEVEGQVDRSSARHHIQDFRDRGVAFAPEHGTIRWLGEH